MTALEPSIVEPVSQLIGVVGFVCEEALDSLQQTYCQADIGDIS